jgi:hypothetical protein
METLEEARSEKTSRREAEAQARAETEARAAKCQENRARLESYLQAHRLYRENDAGERQYLDDEQILEARRGNLLIEKSSAPGATIRTQFARSARFGHNPRFQQGRGIRFPGIPA